MSFLKTIWGTLFRLFPAPTPLDLRRIGNPGRDSPVLLTCNFDLTVKRLTKTLRGLDVWLLVAESKGVNVWCAAGGQEMNTHSVVSVVKTSGISKLVAHRDLVLPPLAAPGVRKADVEEQTGWKVHWGPVYADEIPRYLAQNRQRDEDMKRATYGWRERLDTGLGSLFPFYLVGAVGFGIFGRKLLPDYLAIGAGAFTAFMLACPWLPGKTGLAKALYLDVLIGAGLIAAELWGGPLDSRIRADLIIAMAMLLLYGSELGGLASTMPSDLAPFLARLGVNAIGNVAFADTMRTDLLNGYRKLSIATERCESCEDCTEVCPLQVWDRDEEQRAVLARIEDCTACVMQCKSGAIKAAKVS